MKTQTTIDMITWFWIAVACITFVTLVLLKIRAPYGRHTRKGWGQMIPNHLGWFWMELPALLLCPMMTVLGPAKKDWMVWVLMMLWIIHYFNRTILFPFKLKTKGKHMPLSIMLSALFFNLLNGFLNGYALGFMTSPQRYSAVFFVGIIIFMVGFYINKKADQNLINLRKYHQGYHIPDGWLFDRISCPNHFGEIIEWTGYAIAAFSLQAVSFAIWTFANLVPRALNHHAWYHESFDDYPKKRKAVIPFFL